MNNQNIYNKKFNRRNYLSEKLNGGKPKKIITQTLRVIRLLVSFGPLFEEDSVLIETFPGSGYYVNFDYYQNLTLNVRDIMKIRDISFEDTFENLDEFLIKDLRDCPGLKQFYEICIRPQKELVESNIFKLKMDLKTLEQELYVLNFYNTVGSQT